MSSRTRSWLTIAAILLPVTMMIVSAVDPAAAQTVVHVADKDTGRRIACDILNDEETVTLQWTNSLFRLLVTETYKAQHGMLVQTGVTFANSDHDPPRVRPEDVEDLYHTGGPFTAEGLSKRFRAIVFRVGQIGQPVLAIRENRLELHKEVGFGGAVLVKTSLQRDGFPYNPCLEAVGPD